MIEVFEGLVRYFFAIWEMDHFNYFFNDVSKGGRNAGCQMATGKRN